MTRLAFNPIVDVPPLKTSKVAIFSIDVLFSLIFFSNGMQCNMFVISCNSVTSTAADRSFICAYAPKCTIV